jgi:tetratricopeptide (TPR) repeat protein
MSETRKLAAILVADIVGYSRLAGADEDRTLARVRGLRSDLIDPAIVAHHGRIVKQGSLEEVFDLQDKVAITVAGVIEPTLRQSEIERARRKRPDSLDAYDLYLRALPYAFTPMPEDADKALPLLGKAIELEPDYAAAHAIIAWCHEARYLRGGMQDETRLAALHHARLAIAGGSDDAATLATAGFVVAVCGRDYETALTAFDRSFALSSTLALALGFSSIVRAWRGDDAIAVEQASRALRLSPFDPLIYLPYIALAYPHFAAGRFEEMVSAANLAAQSNPRFTTPLVLLAAALGCLDRSEDAKTVVRRLLELRPGITVGTAILSARYMNPEKIAELANALRRAGLPEG